MTRQTNNEHLSNPFIYYGHSIFIEDATHNAHYGMLYISTMNDAWLGLAAQAFL
jgi:hypothetical protein